MSSPKKVNGISGSVPKKSGANGKHAGRLPDGTFAPGHSGGPGRPKSRRSAIMEHAFDEALTPDKAKAIVAKILECALAGESWAAKEILDRTIGKVKENVNITGEFTLTEFYRALGLHLRAS